MRSIEEIKRVIAGYERGIALTKKRAWDEVTFGEGIESDSYQRLRKEIVRLERERDLLAWALGDNKITA